MELVNLWHKPAVAAGFLIFFAQLLATAASELRPRPSINTPPPFFSPCRQLPAVSLCKVASATGACCIYNFLWLLVFGVFPIHLKWSGAQTGHGMIVTYGGVMRGATAANSDNTPVPAWAGCPLISTPRTDLQMAQYSTAFAIADQQLQDRDPRNVAVVLQAALSEVELEMEPDALVSNTALLQDWVRIGQHRLAEMPIYLQPGTVARRGHDGVDVQAGGRGQGAGRGQAGGRDRGRGRGRGRQGHRRGRGRGSSR